MKSLIHSAYNVPGKCNLELDLPMRGRIALKIFDVMGREAAILVDEVKDAGSYEVKFDASTMSSGLYFYALKANQFVETKRMTVIK